MLRMIAGLEEITDGALYIGGKLMNHAAPKDRDIAMVFQSYALYPPMTVFENMAFALKLRKLSRLKLTEQYGTPPNFPISPNTWTESPRLSPVANGSAQPLVVLLSVSRRFC